MRWNLQDSSQNRGQQTSITFTRLEVETRLGASDRGSPPGAEETGEGGYIMIEIIMETEED
jgi:hypothetical protein